MRGTYATHCDILDLINLIILRAEYELRSASLCNWLHPAITFTYLYLVIILNVREEESTGDLGRFFGMLMIKSVKCFITV
jgi:hypothetical protein